MTTSTEDFHFFQGSKEIEKPLETLKSKVRELCNMKHLNFLFGAGSSSGAIPTMKEIKESLDEDITKQDADLKNIYDNLSQDNLEDILNTLYAKHFYLEGLKDTKDGESKNIQKLILYLQGFMFKKINIPLDTNKAKKVLEHYNRFYLKLAFRNKDLARINVFTTNNDLFNEKSLDHLNINYNNGFGGGLERVFNPARFSYTFSKKVDLNLEKFEPLENMVYLYKLHGSVNWIKSEGNSLFKIKELAYDGSETSPDNRVLIYPTPLKQNQSLGSPYADLIREFQAKLTLPNSVIFIIGYSFSDEHLNNIIYQALSSNASLSVVIFGNHKKCALAKIGDSRIYRFYGSLEEDGEPIKAHYFDYIVKEILPDADENQDKGLLESFAEQLSKVTKSEDK